MHYSKFNDEVTDDDPEIFQPTGIDGVLEFDDLTLKVKRGSSELVPDTSNDMPKQRDRFTVYTQDVETGDDAGKDYADDPAKIQQPETILEQIRQRVKTVVEHIVFRAFTSILIIVDLILVIVDLAEVDCSRVDALQIVSLVIITYFLLEVAARIFYMQKDFFKSTFDVIDMAVVVLSLVVDVTLAAINNSDSCNNHYARLVVIGRVVRIARIVRLLYLTWTQKRQVALATRRVISENKQRYRKDGFDLDLCYITERIIAMSFPSTGLTSMYRNPIKEVARFLNTKHANHYKVYNLCSERDYDETLFQNRVERVFIDDHNVPKLSDMLAYTDDVREWMSLDQQNVIAVHCKGGKGRTGTMICTWLVDCGLFDDAEDSLDYFGERRTDLSLGLKFQGVETPSQSRYVGYYGVLLKEYNRVLPPSRQLIMTFIKLQGLSGVGTGDGTDFSMEIYTDGVRIYESSFTHNTNCQVMRYKDTDSLVVRLNNSPILTSDIKVRFTCSSKNVPKGYENCPFFFWFHTSFIEDNKLFLPREELDNPHKEKTWNVFGHNFAVEATFEEPK